MTDLKMIKLWIGTYKGVGFEIKNWQTPPNIIAPNKKDHWTYYLHICLDEIPKENNPDSYWLKGREDEHFHFVFYDYHEHDVLSQLNWHGGITYYAKISGFDGAKKVIKVGCDYMHIWDEGKDYDLDMVESDCNI